MLPATALAVLLCLIAPASAQSIDEVRPAFRAHGVIVHVPDIEAGLIFYRDRIGFEVADQSSTIVRLKSAPPLYLVKSESSEPRYPEGRVRPGIAFQTADIEARQRAWTEAGVDFLQAEPTPNGVGVDSSWRDPFGTRFALIEQRIAPSPPFDEPHIYNYGFSHADVSEARAFYVDLLGFVVRTERFYPPALPLGHADGSFAFMLHEDLALAEVEQQAIDGAGTSIVFSTPDIDKALSYLRAAGASVSVIDPETRAGRNAIAIVDPAGLQSEIWELPDSD